MKTLKLSDLPLPKVKEDLIGRVYDCPFGCGVVMDIGSAGVEHWGHKHGVRYSLNDLFRLADFYEWCRKREYELWFGKK
jgi:hypothetical protein